MMQSTNQPYVKKFNKDGICTNPLKGAYINHGPNRRERRAYMQRKASGGPKFVPNA